MVAGVYAKCQSKTIETNERSAKHRLKTYYVPGIGNGDDVMKHSMSVANQIHNNQTQLKNVDANADNDMNGDWHS